MRNLLNFLFKYGYWFLFLLLETISFTLLFRFNTHQGNVGLTTANWIAGELYTLSADISSFFQLRTANEQLTRHNFDLQAENQALRQALHTYKSDSLINSQTTSLGEKGFQVIPARVVNNSLIHPNNYITLDKGKADGITVEMGVINGSGVIGIVYMTSEHYALAISLLNSKSSLSCKFKNNDYFGYLKWRGDDSRYAFLEDVPRHALFQQGDTIVTSGHSAVFPKGIMVGTVDDIADSKDGLSYLLRIRLATDFACLDDALVISNSRSKEQHRLEQQADLHKK